MLNVAAVALGALEFGAVAAGIGTLGAFVYATANEHARVNKLALLRLPDSVISDRGLFDAFAALVTSRGHTEHLERAARRVDRLLRLYAAVSAPNMAGRVTCALHKSAVEYERSVRHYLQKYFVRSCVPLYDRERRAVPGEDFEHAKTYGAFPIPYGMKCAHAAILDTVNGIVHAIHDTIPEKLREHAATLPYEYPRSYF